MSSTPDPSSSAAHSAQDDTGDDAAKPGLLGWIFGSDKARDPDLNEDDTDPPTGADGPSAKVGLSNLRRLRLEDVAIPRAEIMAVPADVSLPDLLAVFRESGNSRLPVYDETLDSPMGMVHLKDVALRYGFNGGSHGFDLTSMLRPVLYAPPSMPIGVMLQKMQSDRTHMALMIDEYGGVDGLVTIEDLIEQVIGEIEDEHDVEEAQLWTRERPGSYLALARAPLKEFEAEIGIKLVAEEDEEEIDTLGGLVFVLTGRVPVRSEVIRHASGLEFEVIDADPRRIKRLRVRLPHDKAAE